MGEDVVDLQREDVEAARAGREDGRDRAAPLIHVEVSLVSLCEAGRSFDHGPVVVRDQSSVEGEAVFSVEDDHISPIDCEVFRVAPLPERLVRVSLHLRRDDGVRAARLECVGGQRDLEVVTREFDLLLLGILGDPEEVD